MSFVIGLKCRECGQDYAIEPLHVCETCFGPLEIQYDYDAIKKSISREKIAGREPNLWRYRELLPIDGEPRVGQYSGFTPLVRAHRLGEALGVKELYLLVLSEELKVCNIERGRVPPEIVVDRPAAVHVI